jgi:hypothetical protein
MSTAESGTRGHSFWHRAKDKLTGTTQDLEAAELKASAQEVGCKAIARHVDRERCTLHGTLRHVTLRPHGSAVALEAELYDGSGTVTLVWLGRRQIPGITPGRQLTVSGRLSCLDGQRLLYNPRYELAA